MNFEEIKNEMHAAIDVLHDELIATHGKAFANLVRAQVGARGLCEIFRDEMVNRGFTDSTLDFVGSHVAEILARLSTGFESGLDIDHADVVAARNKYHEIHNAAQLKVDALTALPDEQAA